MLGLLLTVAIGASVLAAELLAPKLRLAPPLLMLAAGSLLGLVPALSSVQLPSEVVLLLFLPVLLYAEAIDTSLRELRRYLRGILLQATVLVALTAAAVAVVAHAFGLPWPVAWVLGAALAPTDATAVAAFGRALPRQQVTILRAESLLNDGMALTIYALAVGVVVREQPATLLDVSWRVVLAYGGGAAAGALVAWAGIQLRKRITDQLLGNLLALLTPFVAYLLAEAVGASGVLATVLAGLVLGQLAPRLIRARTRTQATAFWSLSTFVLNGALFVLVGIQLHTAVAGLSSTSVVLGLAAVLAVSVTLVAVRIPYLFASVFLIRALDRSDGQQRRRMPHATRVVRGLAGFRGAVSLAAALGVPMTLASGDAFPDRDLLVFVAAGVIVVTLVGQGLLLPVLVRWARFPSEPDSAPAQQRAALYAAEVPAAARPQAARRLDVSPAVAAAVGEHYEQVLSRARKQVADPASSVGDTAERDLRLALQACERQAVIGLRDLGDIDDEVLHALERRLDAEEMCLRDG